LIFSCIDHIILIIILEIQISDDYRDISNFSDLKAVQRTQMSCEYAHDSEYMRDGSYFEENIE